MQSLWLGFVAALALVACGGDDGTSSTGTDAGIAFTAPPKFTACTTRLGFPGLPGIVTQNGVTTLVAADLDGDGVGDLVAIDGTVVVAMGLGGGLYAPFVRYPVPTATTLTGLAVGDLDGDGKPDIATTTALGPTSFAIQVLHGKGDGTFTAPTSVATKAVGTRVAIADVDGGGVADLVMADASGNAAVFLGTGSGAFGAEIDTAGGGSFLAIADVTGDGKPDLVGAQATLANTGAGTFAAPVALPGSIAASAVAVADFTGDTKLDIAVGGGSAALFVNDGSGNFTEHDLPATATTAQLAAADLDGDHVLDLVETDPAGVRVLHNHGDGTFDPAVVLPAAAGPLAIVAADLDGDGAIDVATTGASNIDILRNDGHGNLDARVQITATSAPGTQPGVLIADVTGDGKPDLVWIDRNKISVLPNTGSRTAFGAAIDTPFPAAVLSHGQLVDVDGDGKLDVVVGAPGGVLVAYGAGDGTFTTQQTYAFGFDATTVAAGDLDGDGKADLEANTATTPVTVQLGLGNRSFGAVIVSSNAARAQEVLINGNELVTSDPIGATMFVETLSDGVLGPVGGYEVRMQGLALADTNGDGVPDLISRGQDLAFVFDGNTDHTLDQPDELSLPGPVATELVADLDGDGDVDLVIDDPHGVSVSRGHDKSFDARAPYAFDVDPTFGFSVGDLDGDGEPDIAQPEGDGSVIGIRYGACR